MTDSPKKTDMSFQVACLFLPLSIVLYAVSLTMNVARVEGHVIVNNEGINEMLKEKAAKEIPLDEASDQISELIRDYVWDLKRQASSEGGLAAAAANQINVGDISRTVNKEVKSRGQPVIESMMPSLNIEIPSPAPEVQEIKLLETIKDLFLGTETADPDVFLAICILLFTIFFPISKYIALGLIMVPGKRDKARVLNWLKSWGQWSMGDVFVVAFMVTFLKINSSVISSSSLAEVKVHVTVLSGMYVFGSAIILSMIASMLLTRHVSEAAPVTPVT
ncbi:MAG: paraquat-inducible protein A [Verrucomicrobiota bacterium]|nr:paraquat-inducible protein A [Verrucomicrobiota bacterium]